MITLQDRTRTRKIAFINIEELSVELNLQEYSLILLSLSNQTAQEQCIKDFKKLFDFNVDFNVDLIEPHIHLLMSRYNLLINYGADEEVTEIEQEVSY